MKPSLPQRKSPRMPGYDYSSSGYYFVTICAHDMQHLFGEVDADGKFHPNPLGKIVEETWVDLPNHHPGVCIDTFVVMPNHFHSIILLTRDNELSAGVRAGRGAARTKTACLESSAPAEDQKGTHPVTLSQLVREFKSYSALRINHLRQMRGMPVWKRSFHDHFIRTEDDYQRIWEYIQDNPSRWSEDTYFG